MRSITALLTVLVAACSSPQPLEPQRSVPLSSTETLAIKIGERIGFAGEPLVIALLDVQDSRCPQNVTCVWAGGGRVVIQADSAGGNAKTFDLHTGVEPRSLNVFGYRFTLESLEPAPVSTEPVKKDRYVAHLRIVKL